MLTSVVVIRFDGSGGAVTKMVLGATLGRQIGIAHVVLSDLDTPTSVASQGRSSGTGSQLEVEFIASV